MNRKMSRKQFANKQSRIYHLVTRHSSTPTIACNQEIQHKAFLAEPWAWAEVRCPAFVIPNCVIGECSQARDWRGFRQMRQAGSCPYPLAIVLRRPENGDALGD